jgi:hypothetical protein
MEQYTQAPTAPVENLFELQVDHELSGTLTDTAKWAKFVSIVGMAFSALLLYIVFNIGTLLANLPIFGGGTMGAGGFIITTFYVIVALCFFFPSLFAFNFSRKLQLALRNNDQDELNSAFATLKLRFKFLGIVFIVYLSLITLIYIIAKLA